MLLGGALALLTAFTLPPPALRPIAPNVAVSSPRMMFGGGDKDGEGGGFMDKLKQAQQMFNPGMTRPRAPLLLRVLGRCAISRLRRVDPSRASCRRSFVPETPLVTTAPVCVSLAPLLVAQR